jgi:hypothetical protein
MGGWCPRRDRCQLHEPRTGSVPIEKLCEDGDFDAYVALSVKTWEPVKRTPATWHEALA